jgi:peptide methionine sulfoxide reductase MsrA
MRIARAYIAQLDQARVFDKPIVTTLELNKPFFDAEAYHQDYLTLNPCWWARQINLSIAPKALAYHRPQPTTRYTECPTTTK